jgi:hypothetical protein
MSVLVSQTLHSEWASGVKWLDGEGWPRLFFDAEHNLERPMGKLLSATIAATLALVAPAYAQVRVITGDTEHAYGPGGQLLDDAELRAKNERIESARQIEKQRRQEEADADQRSKTGTDQAISNLNKQLERSLPKRGSKTAE